MSTKKEKDMPEKKDKPNADERRNRAERIVGSPEWTEKHVIPLGERGALLWRHVKSLCEKNRRLNMRRVWERYAKDVKNRGKRSKDEKE